MIINLSTIKIKKIAEIWANLDTEKKTEYDIYGESKHCVSADYERFTEFTKPKTCGLFVGASLANYVYKVTRYNKETAKNCPFFVSQGCWADTNSYAVPPNRPMKVYKMNERDPYAGNWNKRFIDWKNWGRGYLGDLLCRCANLAKADGMKYFSIQFYGNPCFLLFKEQQLTKSLLRKYLGNKFTFQNFASLKNNPTSGQKTLMRR